MTTPYQEGFRAHQRDEPMTANPYPDYTDVHGQWNDGWREQARKPIFMSESQIAALCGGRRR